MRITNSIVALAIVFVLFLNACKKDDSPVSPVLPISPTLAKGALITNEGNFGKANGSVSFYFSDKDSLANDVYSKANGATPPLGDVIQSALIKDTIGFIVANNSNKVVVVNLRNFKQIKALTDLVQPRYCIVANNKLWISCWNDPTKAGYVSVRNLSTYAEEKKITVGTGPEQMLLMNGKVFVANCGGWITDNTVSVIDTASRAVSSTVTGLADDPTAFTVDSKGTLWVLSAGATDYTNNTNTPSKLHKINTTAFTADAGIVLSTTTHPNRLQISKDKNSLYYGCGSGIYKMDINATVAPASPFINKSFYGMDVNPSTDEIYALEAPNFTSAGNLIRYKADGTLIKTYPVGIGPNGAVFVN